MSFLKYILYNFILNDICVTLNFNNLKKRSVIYYIIY